MLQLEGRWKSVRRKLSLIASFDSSIDADFYHDPQQRYELGGFENVFTREGNLLETILLDTNLSILMIGETPNLSSALGIIGLRGTTHNLRATCFGSPGRPIRAVLRDQMRRIKKESLECELLSFLLLCTLAHTTSIVSGRRLRTVSNDEAQDFSSFNYFSRSRIAQDFDAIEPDTYASLHFPYDIVFGHCLYPHSNWVCQDPSHLLANVLRAVSIASDGRPDPKPVLVILTIPDSHWRDQYKLPEVIEQYKDRFQYLGGNRLVEETLLKFGYWHEKGADRAGRNPHSLHNHVASNLVAHVFVTRGRMREGILS